ncbi:carbohydrate kinase family protein [Microbacterium sulfonylureivorans]|uniref:carbohydrate kinase family protein n=1 Tax=Microbacterium sulfonylureivorans TaxID=2486854 RepID=UPI000FDB4F2D|nr:carbohydrate kinase [Microbacterium sulfonylureivorans]
MTGEDAARIVVIGEALVDVVHRQSGDVDEAPGGSPANVALTLGRLGRAPTLVTRLADDDRGSRILAWLDESDVTVVAVASLRTSAAEAHLDEAGAADYRFDLDWDLDGLDAAIVMSADLVHVGSVAAVLEPGATQVLELVRAVRERASITYDPNIRAVLVSDPASVRRRVGELIGLADIVKASDDDVRWLEPGRDLDEVALEWLARGPSLVVVTLGPDGALAVTRDGVTRIPGEHAVVVDTVGAGDTFMGALIDGVAALDGVGAALRRPGGGIPPATLEAILTRAARAAAITVSRPGADPPHFAELAGAAR